MKARATGLLIVAAVIFLAMRLFTDGHGWAAYVQAAAEGGMVGGLADWFAVTALFRHPLGLPCPHTALVPTQKDQLGRTLGDFVEDNFLTTEIIGEKIRSAGVTHRVAEWLVVEKNAETVARDASAALAGAAGILRDETVAGAIEQGLVGWVRKIPLAPLAGRALQVATVQGRHEELIDAAIRGSIRFLDEHRDSLRRRFDTESPWWVPEAIDDKIFDKLFSGLRVFLTEVEGTPGHEVRVALDERVATLGERLRDDPELHARGEELKEEFLSHPAVQRWIGSLWTDLKVTLQRQAADPSSELRRRLAVEVQSLGRLLASDPELQAKVDRWVESVAGYLVSEHRNQVGDFIASTVAKWNPDDASERIELAVGRDLQFIRINGTVVGSLAGVAIHAIGVLL